MTWLDYIGYNIIVAFTNVVFYKLSKLPAGNPFLCQHIIGKT